MSFRQYGGINYAARNNIVKNNYTNANNLSIMTRVGQNTSVIYVDSGLVMSSNLTFKYMNAPFYGITFSDGTIQTTAITTTDSYWQPYNSISTPVIYYTNRVLIGADPNITEGSVDPSIKLAVNGGIAANGNFYTGYLNSGIFSNTFSVEGSSGNTTVGGTLGVTGLSTFNNDIIQSNSEVNNITQQTLDTNTNQNTLRKTYIYGDLQLRKPTNQNGGAIWLYDVANASSGSFTQFYQSGPTMYYYNKVNSGQHKFYNLTNTATEANPLTMDYLNMTIATVNPPTCSATQPLATDSSTKIPTTAWVQSAIGGAAYWTASGSNIYSSNSGNVGIGTNSPAYKLDINGTLNVSGLVNLGNALTVTGSTTTPVINSSSGTLTLQTNSSPRITVDSSGNVGINKTLGLLYKLDINGTLGVSEAATFNNDIIQSNSETNNITQQTLTTNGNYNTLRSTYMYGDLILKRPTSENGGAIDLYDVSSSSTGYFTQFYQSGTTMYYYNRVNSGQHRFYNLTNTGASANPLTMDYLNMTIATTNPPTCSASYSSVLPTDSSSIIPTTAWVQSAIGGAEYWTASGSNIYSSNSGNVGIGTNSPAYKLDVNGIINTNNYPIWSTSVTANFGTWVTGPVANLNISGNQASVGYYTATISAGWTNFTPQNGRQGGIYWIVAYVSANCTLNAGPYTGCVINLTSPLTLTVGNLVLIRIYVSNFNNPKGYLVDVSRYI